MSLPGPWTSRPLSVPGAVEEEVLRLLWQEAYQAARVRQHRQRQAAETRKDHQEEASTRNATTAETGGVFRMAKCMAKRLGIDRKTLGLSTLKLDFGDVEDVWGVNFVGKYYLPSAYVKVASENGYRNSGCSH